MAQVWEILFSNKWKLSNGLPYSRLQDIVFLGGMREKEHQPEQILCPSWYNSPKVQNLLKVQFKEWASMLFTYYCIPPLQRV